MGEDIVLEVLLFPPSVLKGVESKGKDGKETTQVPVSIGRTSLYVTVIDQKDVIVPIVAVAATAASSLPVGKGTEIIAPHMTEEIEDFVEKGFSEGMLFISSAQGIKLRNIELTGKSDPFIKFQYGTWEARTKTLQNAGDDTIWNELELSTKVTAENLKKEYLIITVYDENNVRSNQIMGTGQLLLKRPANKIGTEIEVNIPLNDKNGKSAGRVVLKLMVSTVYVYTFVYFHIHVYIHPLSMHSFIY